MPTRKLAPIVTLARALIDALPNNTGGLVAKRKVKVYAINMLQTSLNNDMEIVSAEDFVDTVVTSINNDEDISHSVKISAVNSLVCNADAIKPAADNPELVESYICTAYDMKETLISCIDKIVVHAIEDDADLLAMKVLILDAYNKLISKSLEIFDEYDLASAIYSYTEPTDDFKGKEIIIGSVTIKMTLSLTYFIRNCLACAFLDTRKAK